MKEEHQQQIIINSDIRGCIMIIMDEDGQSWWFMMLDTG